MSQTVNLAKAEFRELDAKFEQEINSGKWTKVQFNPDSLKVSFANQVQTPASGGAATRPANQAGGATQQFVGAGTTKLVMQMWFDAMATDEARQASEGDVRKLTEKVAYFITPRAEGQSFVPPAVRFLWGSFQFDGIVESLEENLELFSPEGRPLRASVSISLTQQKITAFPFREAGGGAGPGQGAPGTSKLTQPPQGANMPGMAAAQGSGNQWQAIAQANGIEDPLRLKPGQLIDFQLGRK